MSTDNHSISTRSFLAVALLLLALYSTAAGAGKAEEREEQFQMIIKSSPLYENPALSDYVSEIGQRLAKLSGRKIDYRFFVIDSQMVNAFALEHGDIFVTRGMLAYLQNEAQLAAVLGHEIGHIEKRHHSRRSGAGGSAKALSTLAAMLVYLRTGSSSSANSIYDAGNLMAAEALSGFGRDKELEADEVGAELITDAGYDTQALVDVMSILKDQERFAKVKQKETGKKASGYHGLFASHPRNDKRLLNLIQKAGVDNARGRMDVDDERFRQLTNGLRFSDQNLQSTVVDNTYYNRNLNFKISFPEGWQVKSSGSVIQAANPLDGARIQLKARRADPGLTPEGYLLESLNINPIVKTSSLTRDSHTGFTGIQPGDAGKPGIRWGVIYYMGAAYVFTARAGSLALESAQDPLFIESFESFSPLAEEDLRVALAGSIQYIRAPEGAEWADLAADSPLTQYAEEELRLLNGQYPRGEPDAGDWIKVVQ